MMKNLWQIPDGADLSEEFFETLFEGNIRIERIISHGQVTPAGSWYDQDADEWVVLLQGKARLVFADGRKQELTTGDSVFIAALEKHRVEYTSSEPPCIWLAVHGLLRK